MEVGLKLLPCPFCGVEPVLEPYCKNGLSIRCPKCLVEKRQKVLRFSIEWLKGELIKWWNTRC
jgi:hypothetical protein